jgi:hypothetical protein
MFKIYVKMPRRNPQTPHAVRKVDRDHMTSFDRVVDLLRLVFDDLEEPYTNPDQDELIGVLPIRFDQGELSFRSSDAVFWRQKFEEFLEDLARLAGSRDRLETDASGFLTVGGSIIRRVSLLTWYKALENLGNKRSDLPRPDGLYVFPYDIVFEDRPFQIPLAPLPEIRNRIEKLKECGSLCPCPDETTELDADDPYPHSGPSATRSGGDRVSSGETGYGRADSPAAALNDRLGGIQGFHGNGRDHGTDRQKRSKWRSVQGKIICVSSGCLAELDTGDFVLLPGRPTEYKVGRRVIGEVERARLRCLYDCRVGHIAFQDSLGDGQP